MKKKTKYEDLLFTFNSTINDKKTFILPFSPSFFYCSFIYLIVLYETFSLGK